MNSQTDGDPNLMDRVNDHYRGPGDGGRSTSRTERVFPRLMSMLSEAMMAFDKDISESHERINDALTRAMGEPEPRSAEVSTRGAPLPAPQFSGMAGELEAGIIQLIDLHNRTAARARFLAVRADNGL